MERIDIRITTKTNLFIGDTPSTFEIGGIDAATKINYCLLYTSPSPRDYAASRMPSSA